MKEKIRQRALELGFDDCRFTTAAAPASAGQFQNWLAGKHHGEMAWLERTAAKRTDLKRVLAGARSVICLAASYGSHSSTSLIGVQLDSAAIFFPLLPKRRERGGVRRPIIQAQIPSPQHSSPLHVAASGKAILAFLDQHEIEDYLKRVRLDKVAPGTITGIDALRDNLARTVEQGYATSFEERMPDAKGASGPIRDITGQVMASISITAPNSRTDEEFALYIRLVTEAAREISKKLGSSRQ